MAVKLDGAALAAKIKMQIREEAAALPRPPMLAVVLAGEDPASQSMSGARSGTARNAASTPGPTASRRRFPKGTCWLWWSN